MPKAKGLAHLVEKDTPIPAALLGGRNFDIVDGKGFVDLPIGLATLTIYGCMDAERNPLPFAPKEALGVGVEATETTIRLEPGVTIDGTVVDAKRVAIEGAKIEARGEVTAWDASGNDVNSLTYGSAVSGDDGSFRITGLGRRSYRLLVQLKSGALGLPDPINVDGGATKITVVLREALFKRVQVTDPKDRAVVGARVRLLLPSETPPRVVFEADTDLAGFVALPPLSAENLPNYELEVLSPLDRGDLTSSSSRLRNSDVAVVILSPGFVIRGAVQDASGAPARALVYAVSHDGKNRTMILGSPVRTKDDGTFEVRGVPNAPVQLLAVPLGSVEVPQDPSLPWIEVVPDHPTVTLKLMDAKQKPGTPEAPRTR